MKREIPSEAVVELAEMLIDRGEEFIENGEALQDMGDLVEGRCRQLCGMLVSDVGRHVLQRKQSAEMFMEIDALKEKVVQALRDAGNTDEDIQKSFEAVASKRQAEYEASKPKCSKCGGLFYWRKIQWCKACDLPMEKRFGHELRSENDGGFEEELS